MMTSKLLWDDQYLEDFAKSLQNGCPEQFWEWNQNDELEELKVKHIRKLMRNFYPSLGVFNLSVETDQAGRTVSDTQPIFRRGCRIEEVDPDTIHAITKRVLMMMEQPLGDELQGLFQGKYEQVWSKSALKGLKVLPNLEPNADTLSTCARYFQNGWIEITQDGVSELKSYDDVDENLIVWNSSVIARDYVPDAKSVDGNKVPTHFKDFVRNICSDEFDDDGNALVDQKRLDNIELAIGFLCHRFNQDSNRRWVVFVDKFYDGVDGNASNGGTGKSVLVKCLSHVMNLVELSGRTITAKKDNTNMWSRVNRSHELVLIDDCSKKFPTDLLLTNTTGDFHIEGKYKKGFSIPAKVAPKIVLTSNFPLEGEGSTFTRRQFVCEISNFYLVMNEEYDETVNTLHGYKDLCSDLWNENDWTEFYKYVFECVSKFLKRGGLPSSQESDFYKRARLIEQIGNNAIFEYLLERLSEYHRSGEEVFVLKFYADVRSQFPTETMDIKDDKVFYSWLKAIGKAFNMHVNRHKQGRQDQQRLTTDRWLKWVNQGLEGYKNNAGNEIKHGDQVSVMRVSSRKRHNGSFYQKPEFNKPDFNKGNQ